MHILHSITLREQHCFGAFCAKQSRGGVVFCGLLYFFFSLSLFLSLSQVSGGREIVYWHEDRILVEVIVHTFALCLISPLHVRIVRSMCNK